jgi:hypothetical protein
MDRLARSLDQALRPMMQSLRFKLKPALIFPFYRITENGSTLPILRHHIRPSARPDSD